MSRETILKTDGLHCASCAYAVERLGRKVSGVEDVRVDAASGTIVVRLEDGADSARAIDEVGTIVRRLGHSAYTA